MTISTVSIPMDSFDQLTAKLSALEANLNLVVGAGIKNFNDHSESVQEDFLWGCHALVRECRDLTKQIDC